MLCKEEHLIPRSYLMRRIHHVRPPQPAESDEHYNRYLREREAMLRPQSAPAAADSVNGHSAGGLSGVFASAESGTEDQTRKDAVE